MTPGKDKGENNQLVKWNLGRGPVPRHMFLGKGNGIFSHNCFARRRVSCNED